MRTSGYQRRKRLAIGTAWLLCVAFAGGELRAAATPAAPSAVKQSYLGFDRNGYPGNAALPALRRHFTFAGYWLNAPPGERGSSWLGHRAALREAGFGFLLLWNGRLDRDLLANARTGTRAEALGRADADAATRAARAEGFPAGAVIFLDQEEGGRLLPEQAAYLLAWTEAVALAGFRPGVYGSGQPVDEGPAPGGGRATITTAEDIRAHVAAGHLHAVDLWVAQDSCPPAPGCVLTPPPTPDASGTPGALVWQFAQSPRRPAQTRSCAGTYAPDGNCYAPELPGLFVDLNVSRKADPSGGR